MRNQIQLRVQQNFSLLLILSLANCSSLLLELVRLSIVDLHSLCSLWPRQPRAHSKGRSGSLCSLETLFWLSPSLACLSLSSNLQLDSINHRESQVQVGLGWHLYYKQGQSCLNQMGSHFNALISRERSKYQRSNRLTSLLRSQYSPLM